MSGKIRADCSEGNKHKRPPRRERDFSDNRKDTTFTKRQLYTFKRQRGRRGHAGSPPRECRLKQQLISAWVFPPLLLKKKSGFLHQEIIS